jgi:hypothetical protein
MSGASRQLRAPLGILLLVLTACAAVEARSKDSVIVYEDSARTVSEKYQGSEMQGGAVEPKRPIPAQTQNLLYDEEVTRAVSDCSTAQYRCSAVWSRVFAVPRKRLSPAATFSIAGALLKVDDCLRGDARVCQVALISADCALISGQGCEEVAGGRQKSKDPGPITYFIYNEDFGVTAYGVAEKPARTKDERLVVASQMILQGKYGLLTAPSADPISANH